jgi:UDP-N-acetylglucosamine--N-acetylmuramyl-(pentapeptide) pyrophosphoryl-undecaprenol N-acetylglucosamine transferase
MPVEFAKADLVICRAGATTCAELAAAGKASIMIPLPTAADDHQRKNAEALARAGAAKMILQAELDGQRLAKEIFALSESPAAITEMEAAAKELGRKDAAEKAADLIEELKRNV